jgi:hypothetical protein
MHCPFWLETESGKMVIREAVRGRLTLAIRLKSTAGQGKLFV